jgi:negative regulator of sigma E activity
MQVYDEVVKQVDTLRVEEQLRLAAHILERVRQAVAQEETRHKWTDIRGLATYPMLGEDAQAWVSRTRRESDERRQKQWRE